jgi:hypothetical protein
MPSQSTSTNFNLLSTGAGANQQAGETANGGERDTHPNSTQNNQSGEPGESSDPNHGGRNDDDSEKREERSEDDGDEDEKDDPEDRRTRRLKRVAMKDNYNLFTGILHLDTNRPTQQEFRNTLGVTISPKTGKKRIECTIVMDPIVVTVSDLEGNERDKQGMFTIADLSVIVGTSDGNGDIMEWSPSDEQFDTAKNITTRRHLAALGTASVSPSLGLNFEHEREVSRETSAVSRKFQSQTLSSLPRGGHKWTYVPIKPPKFATAIQMTTNSPPVHSAKYIMRAGELPDSIVVGLEATYKRSIRVPSFHWRGPAIKHIVTCLSVNIGEGRDSFMFPTEEKEGGRIVIEIVCEGSRMVERRRTGSIQGTVWKVK